MTCSPMQKHLFVGFYPSISSKSLIQTQYAPLRRRYHKWSRRVHPRKYRVHPRRRQLNHDRLERQAMRSDRLPRSAKLVETSDGTPLTASRSTGGHGGEGLRTASPRRRFGRHAADLLAALHLADRCRIADLRLSNRRRPYRCLSLSTNRITRRADRSNGPLPAPPDQTLKTLIHARSRPSHSLAEPPFSFTKCGNPSRNLAVASGSFRPESPH